MHKRQPITRTLVGHFFRRFFDNDTTQVEGDTITAVVRAASVVAIPGLMIAFFMQNQYTRSLLWSPNPHVQYFFLSRRPLWGAIEDQYLFVLFSFVVLGAAAVFEWEMLFPDRLDFLVLSPLSLKPMQLLAAKTAALAGFLAIFLVAANLFGALLLPAISHGPFFRQVFAQTVATAAAGIFVALLVLAVGGVLLCLLTARQFRRVSPIFQMLATMALLLFLMQYARYGDQMHLLLANPHGFVRWSPPVWFLALYEHLLLGGSAPAFAADLSRYAVRSLELAAGVAVATYPLAWARVRRMAFEGVPGAGRAQSSTGSGLLHRIVTRPGERALFHFIGQTLARNNRYQVYLAMYCGTGLALALTCAVDVHLAGGQLHPALSARGLHAVLPLLVFWVIAGLRSAFAFPLNLGAGWIFRVTGVGVRECADAARVWVLLCAVALVEAVLVALRLAGWGPKQLFVQMVLGLALSLLLTDCFFLGQHVPFNRPRMPGKTSLPLVLTLYIGVLPPALVGFARLAQSLEQHLVRLLPLALAAIVVHLAFARLHHEPTLTEEELEGYEGELQLLGLS